MLKRLVLREVPLAYRHKCKLQRGPLYSFSYIEAEKQIDLNKASIKIMIQPLKFNHSLQILNQARTCGHNSKSKIFYFAANKLSLGALSPLFIGGYLNVMQSKYSMRICLDKLIEGFELLDDSLQIDKDRNLNHLLTVIEMIQIHSHQSVIRSYLAFLGAYFIKNPQIKNEHKNLIVQFLSKRGYTFEQMFRYLGTVEIDDDKILEQIIEQDDYNKIREYFENLIHVLKAMFNIQKIKDGIVNQQTKQKLINLYFKMLENKQILPLLLNIKKMSFLWLNQLLQQKKYRNRFTKIFLNVFHPSIYSVYCPFQNFQMDIFDKLYVYYPLEQGPQIYQILSAYQQCSMLTINSRTNRVIDYSSLICLWYKHKYESKNLQKLLIKKYFQYGLSLKQKYRIVGIGRQRTLVKNEQLLFLNSFIYFFKIQLNDDNNNTKNILKISNFIFRRWCSIFLQNFNQYVGLNLCLNVINIQKIRETNANKKFYKHYQIYVKNEQKQILIELTKKIQNTYKITCNQDILKKNTYLLSSNHNNGVRLKLLFNLINFYSQFTSSTQAQLEEIFTKVTSSNNLINAIKQNISYPGLIQSIYYFYEYYYYQFKNNQANQILQSLQIQRNKISKKLAQTLMKQKSYQKKDLKIQYMHNIEHLVTPLKVLPNFYSTISQHLGLNYNQIHQLNQTKELRQNLKNFLFSFATNYRDKISLSYPVIQYPFYADFLILTFDQRITLLIVPIKQKNRLITQEANNVEQIPSNKKVQENDIKKIQNMTLSNHNDINYRYFKRKNKVILISNEEDIEKAKIILSQIVLK